MQAPECTGCNDRERLAHSAVDVDGLGSNARVDQLTPVEADARTISRARCCDVSAHVIAVPPPRSIAELIEALPRVWPPSTPPEQAAEPADLRTTVLLQNLPRAMEVGDVCCFLDQLGLACAYNVVLMPTGKRRPRRTKGFGSMPFVGRVSLRGVAQRSLDGAPRAPSWTALRPFGSDFGAGFF